MARKKDSKALFEVLSRTDTTMSVPDWMKAKPAGDAAAAGAEKAESKEGETPTPPAEEDVAPARDVDAAPPEAQKDAPASVDGEIDVEVENEPVVDETIEYEDSKTVNEAVDSDEPEEEEAPEEVASPSEEETSETVVESPALQPESRRKIGFRELASSEKVARFSLNLRSIVLLIVVAGVLISLAVALGLYTVSRMKRNPTSTREQTPTQNAERRSVVTDDAPVACVSGRRDPDRYFLIIETLRGNGDADKTEAERIIEFCKARGLPADMVELQRGNQTCVAVWCLVGFRFANSEPALEHARNVERIGQDYFTKFKTYTFQQRKHQDGSIRPLFVSGKKEQSFES